MNSLYKKIKSAEVISFDMFDTLVIRKTLNPNDVFQAIGEENNIPDFSSLREEAQRLAFLQMEKEGKKEIHINDIYAQFSDNRMTLLKEKEIEKELETCITNSEMMEVYRFASQLNKKIILTSDMYLDEKTITRILKKCGYLSFHKIYVSSSRNANKRDGGDLFKSILQELGVKAGNVLHIGDNMKSDVQIPRKLGIKTHYYPKISSDYTPVSFSTNSLIGSLYNGHMAIREYDKTYGDKNYWYRAGYSLGGLLHKGFLDWIDNKIITENIDFTLFLSRDGYLLEKIYKKTHPDYKNSTSYFYGSRVSFTLASINEKNFPDSLDFFTMGYEKLSVHEFFERVNLPLPDKRSLVRAGLTSYEEIIDSGEKIAQIRQLFIEIKELILKKCEISRINLKKYIQSSIGKSETIALVDVGWSGSSQTPFVDFMKQEFPEVKVVGLYMALLDTVICKDRMKSLNMKSYICSPHNNIEIARALYPNRAFIELFFSAPHHSVVDYSEENNNILPIFDGGRNEKSEEEVIIDSINDGIVQFISHLGPTLPEKLPALDAISPMLNFLNTMNIYDHIEIKKIESFDTWSSTKNRQVDIFQIA